jgi:hypothetical protein
MMVVYMWHLPDLEFYGLLYWIHHRGPSRKLMAIGAKHGVAPVG